MTKRYITICYYQNAGKWVVSIYNRPAFTHPRVLEYDLDKRTAELTAEVWAQFFQCDFQEGRLP